MNLHTHTCTVVGFDPRTAHSISVSVYPAPEKLFLRPCFDRLPLCEERIAQKREGGKEKAGHPPPFVPSGVLKCAQYSLSKGAREKEKTRVKAPSSTTDMFDRSSPQSFPVESTAATTSVGPPRQILPFSITMRGRRGERLLSHRKTDRKKEKRGK